jgi:hypothetical protein
MTKKNFIAAAKIVKRMREAAEVFANTPEFHVEEQKISRVENAFVALFIDDNPSFDENRFRAACK